MDILYVSLMLFVTHVAYVFIRLIYLQVCNCLLAGYDFVIPVYLFFFCARTELLTFSPCTS